MGWVGVWVWSLCVFVLTWWEFALVLTVSGCALAVCLVLLRCVSGAGFFTVGVALIWLFWGGFGCAVDVVCVVVGGLFCSFDSGGLADFVVLYYCEFWCCFWFNAV